MGAEPGRRSLKMPAEKLGPVIVGFTDCRISKPTLPVTNAQAEHNFK